MKSQWLPGLDADVEFEYIIVQTVSDILTRRRGSYEAAMDIGGQSKWATK